MLSGLQCGRRGRDRAIARSSNDHSASRALRHAELDLAGVVTLPSWSAAAGWRRRAGVPGRRRADDHRDRPSPAAPGARRWNEVHPQPDAL